MTSSAPGRRRGTEPPVSARLEGALPEEPEAPEAAPRGRGEYRIARDLFLRGLGLVFAIAFASLWVQVPGLLGEEGILPASDYLARARAHLGGPSPTRLPTLAWWTGAGGAALRGLCVAGLGASLLLVLGVLPALGAALCWVLYLSLVAVGQVFLAFQWDSLLLEAGFVAAFLAPWQLRSAPHRAPPPGRAALFMVRLLLVQLMLQSGVTKLTSGDPTWWDLTALEYHYWTQPLPTPLAWYVDRLPDLLHRASCLGMFVVEVGLPLLVFLPGRPRRVAGLGFVGLMVLIAATGNYTFFNLLTALLALPLFDDASLGPWLPGPLQTWRSPCPRPEAPTAQRLAAGAAAALLATACAGHLLSMALGPERLPGPLRGTLVTLAPLRTFSSYGLFRVMTTTRPEVDLQWTVDGETWTSYRFRYKPGPLGRAPPVVAPHQPRLDWQMWFAALRPGPPPWFQGLVRGLLEARPAVHGLLEPGSCPPGPPAAVRALRYEYRFAAGPDAEAGHWWTREAAGSYLPPVALRRVPP